jgi:DNA-directed RNA polymerase I subunit RPA2
MVADKLNNTRYLSHFRSIHRGQYFTEMKTTTVRKLLPEAWGFICPVHTPDGAPCGLLNHITLSCAPLAFEDIDMKENFGSFKTLCTSLGMNPVQTDFNLVYPADHLPVTLDGILLGYVDPKLAPTFSNALR